MFDAVTFESFKCLAKVTIPLGRLTLLVGANASGKSSVLDGLHLLCQLGAPREGDVRRTDGRAGEIFGGAWAPARLLTSGEPGPLAIGASVGTKSVFGVRVERDGHQNGVRCEIRFVDSTGEHSLNLPNNTQQKPDFFAALDACEFGRAVRLRLDPAKIASYAPDSEHPRVDEDGFRTGVVLAWMAEQRSDAIVAIENDLKKVVPGSRRLIPDRVTIPVPVDDQGTRSIPIVARRFSLEQESGAIVAADLLSEGTLLTIGLLTVLHASPKTKLVLLDDFDRGLHPRAQKSLVECVIELQRERPDLQVVCTTHSPFVLDLFAAEDVCVLRRDAAGHTIARKLTEHPEWLQWKDTMKAGEFWSYVGEDWLDAAAE